jgi:hypothetical protein
MRGADFEEQHPIAGSASSEERSPTEEPVDDSLVPVYAQW